MTIKSVRDEDFMHWQVRDLDTGELVDNVEWADDNIYGSGKAAVILRIGRGHDVTRRVVWGNFRLEDKREQDTGSPHAEEKDPLLEALEGSKKIVKFFEMLVEERTAWRAGG